LSAITADGSRIKIMGNIEFPEEAKNIEVKYSDGIGLFRTEFLYFLEKKFPGVQRHFKIYKKTLNFLPKNLPLFIRVFDIGGDKLNQKFGLHKERNPFLGCRGIRFLLRYPLIFKNQLKGILKVSNFGNIKIMLPMISLLEEVKLSKEIIEEVKDELREENIPFDENIEIGVMVETPSAALIADSLAKNCDFFSIGTNDLTQYVLAADRNNETFIKDFNYFHPSVLKLIKSTIRAGKQAGIPVSICGEMGSDPIAVPLLLGMGMQNLSINLKKMLEIKENIRRYSLKKLKHEYEKIENKLDFDLKNHYQNLLAKFN